MQNHLENLKIFFNTTVGMYASFLIANAKTIGSLITFLLTCFYFIYKVKHAITEYKIKKHELEMLKNGKHNKEKK